MFCWSHDVQIAKLNKRINIDQQGLNAAAKYVQEFKPKHSKGQSGQKIREVFEQFMEGIPKQCVIDLDPKRDFSEDEKHQIKLACDGKCSRCGNPVFDGDDIYHHKEPWARGGRTVAANGTLLHRKCHEIVHQEDPVRVNV